ncbi:hypothetical protein GAGA_3597 [Paraglaciecola agarilytica NO2]|uniref:Uncharacterized protein n=1 Tax=Paraglaciecola agarilytica NO2 TaxID=1125747 RepID=A0ABQ0IAV4_9ALTE|nr:hypothetical protein GAGA_3597 [Paraglaciecola agarilytica NO2]
MTVLNEIIHWPAPSELFHSSRIALNLLREFIADAIEYDLLSDVKSKTTHHISTHQNISS